MSGPEPIRILLDGQCAACRREGRFIQRLDRGRGLVAIEDIARPGFDPARYGLSWPQVAGSIHAILPGGSVINGMEVFRRVYGAVGRGWMLGWTAWPVLRPFVDRSYAWFARNRVRWFGGCRPDGTCVVR
ncbi:MAG TPA: DUF393 domain-containing protein [Phycisphaerales bacterium]|nr:DUF393 domain-containing protein [Phycisphaerales bacterium]